MLLTLLWRPARAENDDWQGIDSLVTKNDSVERFFSLRYGILNGYTKYRIEFSGGASELEFPLNNSMWGATAGFTFKKDPKDMNNAAKLEFRWYTNTGRDAGKLKDSDWIDDDIGYFRDVFGVNLGQNHSGVDIYSESEASAEARFIDVNYFYNLYPDQYLSFGPKIGYQTIRFAYDINNVNQVGYGPYAPYETLSQNGKVLDYQVDYDLIYLGVDVVLGSPDKVLCTAGFGYSPWTKAKDRDDHIARFKLSEADASGDGYLLDGSADWRFLPNWGLTASGQYTKVHTTGTQHQSFYDGPLVGTTYDVDDIISAYWWQANLGIKYFF
jgi:outer membrane protease